MRLAKHQAVFYMQKTVILRIKQSTTSEYIINSVSFTKISCGQLIIKCIKHSILKL